MKAITQGLCTPWYRGKGAYCEPLFYVNLRRFLYLLAPCRGSIFIHTHESHGGTGQGETAQFGLSISPSGVLGTPSPTSVSNPFPTSTPTPTSTFVSFFPGRALNGARNKPEDRLSSFAGSPFLWTSPPPPVGVDYEKERRNQLCTNPPSKIR